MKKKKISLAIFALLSLSGTITLAAHDQTNSFIDLVTQPFVNLILNKSAGNDIKIPTVITEKTAISSTIDETVGVEKDKKDLVDYYVLFKFADFLEKEAQKAELSGKNTSEYRQFFVREAKLTPVLNEVFRQIVTDCIREVSETDSQALEIIRKEHEKWKEIDFSALGNTPLPEVPELQELQKERDAAILRSRDLLKIQFGVEAFTEFEKEYVKKKVASNIKNLSIPHTQVSDKVEGVKR